MEVHYCSLPSIYNSAFLLAPCPNPSPFSLFLRSQLFSKPSTSCIFSFSGVSWEFWPTVNAGNDFQHRIHTCQVKFFDQLIDAETREGGTVASTADAPPLFPWVLWVGLPLWQAVCPCPVTGVFYMVPQEVPAGWGTAAHTVSHSLICPSSALLPHCPHTP